MQQYKFNIQFHYIRGEKMVNNDSIVDQRKKSLDIFCYIDEMKELSNATWRINWTLKIRICLVLLRISM